MKNNSLEKKWGEKTLSHGWTALPILILEKQHQLKISPNSLNILLHLLSLWWDKDDYPYPSQIAIAKKIGLSPRTVQREIAKMRTSGILKITQTKFNDKKHLGRNIYDLSPLVSKLEGLTEEKPK